jgi:hypothetical protein
MLKLRRLFSLWTLLLCACATVPAPQARQVPLLALAPEQFGAEVSLAQRLSISRADSAATHTLEALLEIDAHSVRLAGFALNQRILTLHWDGQTLLQTASPLLPAQVNARQVLRDIQLVYWPADSLRAALPPGWRLLETPRQRQLWFGAQLALEIDYAGTPRWNGVARLDNRLEGYDLRIESQVQ